MGFIENLFSKSNGRSREYSSINDYSTSVNIPNQSFKERNNLQERILAVERIQSKFPNKVLVIVERYKKVDIVYIWPIKYKKIYFCRRNHCPV